MSTLRLDTHSKDSRIIVYTSPRRGLINGQVLHLRCAEDNILIWLLYGGYELGRGTRKTRQHHINNLMTETEWNVSRKATETSTWELCALGRLSRGSLHPYWLHHNDGKH